MPYGTCNGNYRCDSCGQALNEGSLAWVELKPKKSKIYCMKCKPKESLKEPKPKLKTPQKQNLILKVLLKILKRQNAQLKKENLALKEGRFQK